MNEQLPPSRMSNPFATCWTDDRRCGYVNSSEDTAGDTLSRIAALGWRGQIIGPHGVGKSALLREIGRRAAGRLDVRLVDVSFSTTRRSEMLIDRQQLLLVEGFERLPLWRQMGWLAAWSVMQQRVVVTTHRRVPGLPVAKRLAPSVACLQRLFHHHVRDSDTPVALADAEQIFTRCGGDLRQTWFELHLLHEQRRRRSAAKPVRVAYC